MFPQNYSCICTQGSEHQDCSEMLIDPVDPSMVIKGKQLGQGGQGVAYFATYNGVKLAAKFLLGQITPQVFGLPPLAVDLSVGVRYSLLWLLSLAPI